MRNTKQEFKVLSKIDLVVLKGGRNNKVKKNNGNAYAYAYGNAIVADDCPPPEPPDSLSV